MHRSVRPLAPLALLVVPILVSGCSVNPATGERQLSLIGEEQEIAMGQQSDEAIVAQYGLHPDSSIQRYVRELGLELAAVSERPDLPWTFRVLDDPTVNAFALPGGFIYITRGIMTHLTNEAQLVGILGHEIGHVTARHSVNQMSRAQLAQLGLGVGMIFSETVREYGGLASQSLGLLFLKFGRDDENQADDLGVRYMVREGYDPRELAGVMEMLSRASRMGDNPGRLPEWLSTHPDPENRVENILSRVQSQNLVPADPIVRRTAFLQRLDGSIFGADPREGFRQDGVFYHPELAFQFAPPAGWQFMNGKQAVQMGPQEGDALLEFTFAEGTPADAARAFASQQGVRAGSVSRITINGFEAATMEFRADSEQGELAGLGTWIRQDGRTYRFLGFAPVGAWSARRPAIQSTIASFDDVTDPEILNVEPSRLDMVQLGGPEPLSAFLQRYPSTIEDQRVALINQVPIDGTIPEGLAKRVVGGR